MAKSNGNFGIVLVIIFGVLLVLALRRYQAAHQTVSERPGSMQNMSPVERKEIKDKSTDSLSRGDRKELEKLLDQVGK